MDTDAIEKLYHVLASAAAAHMAGETATAMDALALLAEEAVKLRERWGTGLETEGQEPLILTPAAGPGELPPPSASSMPGRTNGVTPPLGDDRVRTDGRRRRGSQHHRW